MTQSISDQKSVAIPPFRMIFSPALQTQNGLQQFSFMLQPTDSFAERAKSLIFSLSQPQNHDISRWIRDAKSLYNEWLQTVNLTASSSGSNKNDEKKKHTDHESSKHKHSSTFFSLHSSQDDSQNDASFTDAALALLEILVVDDFEHSIDYSSNSSLAKSSVIDSSINYVVSLLAEIEALKHCGASHSSDISSLERELSGSNEALSSQTQSEEPISITPSKRKSSAPKSKDPAPSFSSKRLQQLSSFVLKRTDSHTSEKVWNKNRYLEKGVSIDPKVVKTLLSYSTQLLIDNNDSLAWTVCVFMLLSHNISFFTHQPFTNLCLDISATPTIQQSLLFFYFLTFIPDLSEQSLVTGLTYFVTLHKQSPNTGYIFEFLHRRALSLHFISNQHPHLNEIICLRCPLSFDSFHILIGIIVSKSVTPSVLIQTMQTIPSTVVVDTLQTLINFISSHPSPSKLKQSNSTTQNQFCPELSMSSDLNLPNILVWLKAFADAHYITLSINPQTEPLIADLSTVTATLSLRLMLTDEVKALATAVLTQKNAITITEGKALFLESVRKPCVVIPADTALAPLRLIDSGEWWEESRWALAKISMDARIAAYKDNLAYNPKKAHSNKMASEKKKKEETAEEKQQRLAKRAERERKEASGELVLPPIYSKLSAELLLLLAGTIESDPDITIVQPDTEKKKFIRSKLPAVPLTGYNVDSVDF